VSTGDAVHQRLRVQWFVDIQSTVICSDRGKERVREREKERERERERESVCESEREKEMA
jgi:hypothetical protein